MEKIFKEKRAITLIALVITIVVLIILAGVAISLSLGENGLFKKAKMASEEYTNAQRTEETEIAKVTNEISSILGDRDISEEKIRQIVREEIQNIGSSQTASDSLISCTNRTLIADTTSATWQSKNNTEINIDQYKYIIVTVHSSTVGDMDPIIMPVSLFKKYHNSASESIASAPNSGSGVLAWVYYLNETLYYRLHTAVSGVSARIYGLK